MTASFDYLVGTSCQVGRYFNSERLSGPEVDDKLKFGRLHYRQVDGLFTLEYSTDHEEVPRARLQRLSIVPIKF